MKILFSLLVILAVIFLLIRGTTKSKVNNLTPPPAPFNGPSKTEVIDNLEQHGSKNLPITLGRYEPKAYIYFENDTWILRALKNNPQKEKQISENSNYLMPEHLWASKEPAVILIEEKDLLEFLKKFGSFNID